jgi:hypothetical protein
MSFPCLAFVSPSIRDIPCCTIEAQQKPKTALAITQYGRTKPRAAGKIAGTGS